MIGPVLSLVFLSGCFAVCEWLTPIMFRFIPHSLVRGPVEGVAVLRQVAQQLIGSLRTDLYLLGRIALRGDRQLIIGKPKLPAVYGECLLLSSHWILPAFQSYLLTSR